MLDQHPHHYHPSWNLEGGAQILDLETAVKDGILGGSKMVGGPANGTAEKPLDLKKMVDELETAASADIPAVFICPISLEPMLDPVTLCTGQTYERANILKWFSIARRLTCPTTMQELWDDAVTPNTTLRHLIRVWFSQRYRLMKKRSDDVQGRAAELVDALKKAKKAQSRIQSLKELQALVVNHTSARKTVVADCDGIALISSLLGPFTSHAVGSEAIAVLVNLPFDAAARRSLMQQPAKVSLAVDILNEGGIDSKINCTRFIEKLTEGGDFPAEMVSSMSLLVGLLRLVKDKRHPNGVAAGLSLLKAICCCSHNDRVGCLVVSRGAVPLLVDLLPSLRSQSLDSALCVLDSLSAIPSGRAALKECPKTIPNTVRLLMRAPESCTKHAVSVLLAVCKLSPEESAAVAVEAGLAAKLLMVIQSGCSQAVKQQSAELLKLCSSNYTDSHFISKCKLTRTMQ